MAGGRGLAVLLACCARSWAHVHAPADDAHGHHNCAHDALHAAHGPELRTIAPQLYAPSPGAAPTLEKRAGELEPGDGVAALRIAVYDGFLENDPGMTCYRQGAPFSIGGASVRGPACSAESTTYCSGTCTAQFVLTTEKRAFLQERLIPRLTQAAAALLAVRPVDGGLVLNGGSCGFYGGVAVPDELTRAPGMADADFVLFLTARPIYGDTIAYAGHCQTDQNGRPIAAHFNWSPSHFDSRMDARTFDYYLRVALHELTHALVFSPALLADFPRGEDGRLHSLEMVPSWHGRQRAVVTPRVAAAARAQFGCDAVQGALLEDGGGSGSAGSHWESRLFRDEYMTAAASPGPRVLSALTLALFADSGWYVVRAALAEPLLWGFHAGCDFVYESCAEWERLARSVDGLPLPRFTCTARSADSCHYDQRAKAYCELKRYSFLPPDERYFAHEPELGGYSQMIDYCPVYRAYSNGDCTDESNAPRVRDGALAFVDGAEGAEAVSLYGPRYVDQAQYCPSCRCFETDAPALADGMRAGPLSPGCFRTRCADARTLHVHLGEGRWASCPEAGGVVRLVSDDARGKPLHVKCPPAALLCAFRAENWPRVDAVSPARGPARGGTNVTLTGANFDASPTPPRVFVGDVRASRVVVHSASVLTFVSGADARATSRRLSDISVEDALGRTALSFRAYAYLPGWQVYAETLAMLGALLIAALWAVPRQVTRLLGEHATHVRAREARRRALAAAHAAGGAADAIESATRPPAHADADAVRAKSAAAHPPSEELL